MSVTDWRLNEETHELEWEVYWYSNEYSWEPNSHFAKFNNLIFAFLTGGTVAAAALPVVPP
eukprot:974715-Rhodomonas_salina.1